MPEPLVNQFGNTIYHVWDIPEYTKYPHTPRWYITASIFLLATIGYALYTDNYLFAFILILIAVIFLFHETKEPGLTQFGITDKGVVWRGFLYPYLEVDRFFIVFEPGVVKSLYITFKSATSPRLSIPLEDEDPNEVRETLLRFVREDKTQVEEPLGDVLEKVLKF